MHEHWANITVR